MQVEMIAISRSVALQLCFLLCLLNFPGTTAAAQQAESRRDAENILRDGEVEIVIFQGFGIFDESTHEVKRWPVEVVYTLQHNLSQGRFQVFNDLKIEAEYPLPELTAGKHIINLPLDFYWSDKDKSLPEPQASLSCYLGTSPINDWTSSLWRPNSEPSAYDYRPEPADKGGKLPPRLEDEFRGDDVGFSSVVYPAKRNLELRKSGDLPEVEILGVGFVEGTNVRCGRGKDPRRIDQAPLRDVRVVSTASHDVYDAIPVLKAGRFTVPKQLFQYPSHIRIVGKLQ